MIPIRDDNPVSCMVVATLLLLAVIDVAWFVLQVLTALPQVSGVRVETGVAVLAHVGGFVAGWLLVRPLLPRL